MGEKRIAQVTRVITETISGRQLAQKHNLAGGNLIIYQPPGNKVIRVTSIVILNIHASNLAVYKLYHNESGTSPSINNQIFAGSMPAGAQSDIYNLPIWLRNPDGGIILNSSAAEITITLYGEEVDP